MRPQFILGASISVYLSLLLFLSGFVSLASADSVYDVLVDTSSIQGTLGSLDFNFNPGPLITQPASLQVQTFSTNGSLAGNSVLTGDVNGILPATITFDNGTAFNDYFEGFTFGSTLSFAVDLYGPAVTSPDGISTSGSAFAFSMFSDSAGTIPVLTADATNGFAVTIYVNLDGSTTPNDFSTETSVVPSTTTVPEPNSLIPVLLAVGALCLKRRARSSKRNSGNERCPMQDHGTTHYHYSIS